ncbi:MAG: protein BatD [Bacteroides sp.]|nr:protein BatD [Bacteroides sp.]
MRITFAFRTIALLLFGVLTALSSSKVCAEGVTRAGKDSGGIYLESSLSNGKTIAGAPVLYEVSVVAPSPELSLLSVPAKIDWNGLSVSPVAGDSRFRRETVKGKIIYRAVIARYWITADAAGKYRLPEGKYVLGVPQERVVHDPFWGNMRQSYYEQLPLEAPSLSLKVENLPNLPSGFDFSGAVGEYEVNVWIPDGYIGPGQEALAIVNISGKGDLSEARIPSLREAFSGEVRFKSVTEDRSSYIKDGELCSEIELEVTFIPQRTADGSEPVIGEISFGYYSPSSGKYLKAVSESVKVPFGSSGQKKSSPAEFGV